MFGEFTSIGPGSNRLVGNNAVGVTYRIWNDKLYASLPDLLTGDQVEIQIGATPNDVVSFSRVGDNIVLTLADGTSYSIPGTFADVAVSGADTVQNDDGSTTVTLTQTDSGPSVVFTIPVSGLDNVLSAGNQTDKLIQFTDFSTYGIVKSGTLGPDGYNINLITSDNNPGGNDTSASSDLTPGGFILEYSATLPAVSYNWGISLTSSGAVIDSDPNTLKVWQNWLGFNISTDAYNTLTTGTDNGLLVYAFNGDPTNGLSLDYAQSVEVISPTVVLSDNTAGISINSGVITAANGTFQLFIDNSEVTLIAPTGTSGVFSTIGVMAAGAGLASGFNNVLITPSTFGLTSKASGATANFTLSLSGTASYIPSSDAGTLTNFKNWLGITANAYPGISTNANNQLGLGTDSKLFVPIPSLDEVANVSSKTTHTLQVQDDLVNANNTTAIEPTTVSVMSDQGQTNIYAGRVDMVQGSAELDINITTAPPTVTSDPTVLAAFKAWLGIPTQKSSILFLSNTSFNFPSNVVSVNGIVVCKLVGVGGGGGAGYNTPTVSGATGAGGCQFSCDTLKIPVTDTLVFACGTGGNGAPGASIAGSQGQASTLYTTSGISINLPGGFGAIAAVGASSSSTPTYTNPTPGNPDYPIMSSGVPSIIPQVNQTTGLLTTPTILGQYGRGGQSGPGVASSGISGAWLLVFDITP